MSKYVIDAYAWIEYLSGSEAGNKVRNLLESRNVDVYTCAVTVAEVVSKVAREGREFQAAYQVITGNSNLVNVDEELSKEAGVAHAEMRKIGKDFGLADACVLVVARRNKSKILTGDMHFENIKEAVLTK